MTTDILRPLFERDLRRLKNEISQYQNEENIWVLNKSISNCGGNLCLHLVGNLNAFIGAELGKSGYVRKQELEFSQKNVPKKVLISQIEDTLSTVDTTLEKLSEEDILQEYPIVVFKEPMTTGYFLMHLATHLSYHLGQVNYHRRLMDN